MGDLSDTTHRVTSLLQELIRNKCVNTGDPDSGEEERSIASIASVLDEAGVPYRTLTARQGRPNLVARIPGSDPDAPSLCYMGHVDVVPADPSGWSRDPFGGELVDGEIWGRGAIDMLGQVAASTIAFVETACHGSFPGDLLLVVVSDEEAAGRFGAQWLVEEHWQDVACDYMITEVGGYRVRLPAVGPGGKAVEGSDATLTMSVGEKGVAWARLAFSGTPGHGSMPYRADNAIVKAAKASLGFAYYEPDVVLSPEVRRMVEQLGGPAAMGERTELDQLIARLYRDEPGIAKYLHTASRTTISPNLLSGGEKVNIIPGHADLELDMRVVPGTGPEDVRGLLRRILTDSGVDAEIDIYEFTGANVSAIDTPLATAIGDLVDELQEGVTVTPVLLGGVTDGRFWRRRGTTVYGMACFSDAMTLHRATSLVHAADERIDVESLQLNTRFLMDLPGRFWKPAR